MIEPTRRPGARWRLLALVMLWLMAMLSLERLLIFSTMRPRFADASPGEIAWCFLLGLRFDLSSAALFLIPLIALLAPAPSALWRRRGYQRLATALGAVIAGVVLFLCIADYYFFKEYTERLDHKALHYLQYAATLRLLWHEYPVLSGMAASALVGVAAWRCFARSAQHWYERAGQRPYLAFLLLAPLLAGLAIRGTLASKGLNSGNAYFSTSLPAAQLTLNGLFTGAEAAYSLSKAEDRLADLVATLDPQQALDLATATLVGPHDTPVADADNPLRRITDSGAPARPLNVVLVILESHSADFIHAMGGDGDTPVLDDLIDHSLLMDRCFGIGSRTSYGVCGVLSGFPDLPGRSASVRGSSEGTMLTLASVLARRDYATLFVHGGEPNYDHLRSFLRSNGFDRLVFHDEFDHRTFDGDLGWCDGDLFQQALTEIDRLERRPFLATLLTLSFHRPYTYPAGDVPAPTSQSEVDLRRASGRYTDHAIGEFLRQAATRPWFDDTVFVFVADHAGGPRDEILSVARYRVPFIIHAPRILGPTPRVIHTVCSQTDIAPTVMEILGGSYEHCFFGRSVLSRDASTGLAVMIRSDKATAVVDADGRALVTPFRKGRIQLFQFEPPLGFERICAYGRNQPFPERDLYNRGVALLQVAEETFYRDSFNLDRPVPGH